jgi:hypothetical protein
MRQIAYVSLAFFACGVAMYAGEPGAKLATAPVRPAAAVASLAAVALPAGSEAIRIDGEFTEDAWTKAPSIDAFVERDPHEGGVPRHHTDVRVLFDNEAIYVAIRAKEDDQGPVKGLLTRRDDSSPSDWLKILIDSFHDRRTAFEFGVNAVGVKEDRYWFNDTNSDSGWDAVWDVGVGRSEHEWRAEFRIPFSQLRFKPTPTSTFGFAVVRSVAHNNETSTWPLLAKSAAGFVSSFGDLTGLSIGTGQKKLELLPYAVAQVDTSPVEAGNPLTKSPDPGASAGMDLKYKIGAGLTLTGTANPDFGQVEADPAVVNLSGFETFFAEQRPFFVEGSGNFSFDLDCNDGNCTGLFYSRRIGRAPHVFVDAPDGGYATQPQNTTILGAAKLTGRLGKFSIGGLEAVTGREDATVASGPSLTRSTTTVEPATNYSILRMNREFTNSSRLGFMVTGTNRALPSDLTSLPSSAVTGGVDGDWRLKGGGYSLTGHWAGSTVHGTADAISDLQQDYVHTFQRPDATSFTFDPARTTLNGQAGGLGFGKITGRKLHMSTNFSYKTPGFDTNDLGYLQRADDISMSNWWQILRDVPGKHVRSFRINFNQYAGWNFDHDLRFSGGNINAHWVLNSNWDFGTGFNVNAQGFDDRLTRGGPGGYVPANVNQWAYLDSDNRKRVSVSTFLSWFNDQHGSWSWGASPGVTIRPSSAVSASVGVDFSHNVSDTQWVENVTDGPATHYVFGHLDQTTIGISLRLNYTITPRLSLQLYGQPFVSAGDYQNFRELTNGRAAHYEDRYAPYAYGGQPDFDFHSFRTTNVLRWEYRPGSTLFIVWQQSRQASTSDGEFDFNRDFGRSFTTPGSNVFLVKINRWFNF